MYNFWESEPTEEETERLIARAADEIRKRRLQVPAVLALEMHKPLANVGGHAAIAFAPFLVPFFGFNNVNNYSRIFSNRENVDRLLAKLEEPVAAEGVSP